jgi:uncharacterized membrane protein
MAIMTSGDSLSRPPPRPARHRPGLVGLRPRRGWELHPGVRSEARLSLAERAADRARDGLGSWTFVVAAAVLVSAGVVMAVRYDDHVGTVAVLALVLSGVAVVELSLVLMTARRTDQSAAELAVYDLESDRRAAAEVAVLRDELEWLRGDLARLAARVETSSQQIATRGER